MRDAQGRPALASDSVCIHTGLQPGVSARAEQKPEALEAELSSLTTKASGAVVLNRTVSQTIADVLSFAVYKADRFHASEAGERARDTLTSNSKSINEQKNNVPIDARGDPDSQDLENLESDSLRWLSSVSLLSNEPDTALFDGGSERLFSRSSEISRLSYTDSERQGVSERAAFPDLAMREFSVTRPRRWSNLRSLEEGLETDSIYILKTALLVQDLFKYERDKYQRAAAARD